MLVCCVSVLYCNVRIFTSKVGHTDLVFGLWSVRDQSLSVGLCKHDYKSLCAAVTICATLVNIQTDRQHSDQLI